MRTKNAIAQQNCNDLLKFIPKRQPIRYRVLMLEKVPGVIDQMSVQSAKRLNLNGWVQNLFEGNTSNINQMIGWCSRPGNQMEVVTSIAVKEEMPENTQSSEICNQYSDRD